jgi:hypothetical protein
MSRFYDPLSITQEQLYEMYLSGRRLRTGIALTLEITRIQCANPVTDGIPLKEIYNILKQAEREDDEQHGIVFPTPPIRRRHLRLIPKSGG